MTSPVLNHQIEMLATRIEADEQIPRSWSDVRRLVILTGKALHRLH